jgi:Holliday junction DNA helicase RuvA
VIASLRGKIQSSSMNSLVLDVSGVGYLVQVIPSLALNAAVGNECFVHTAFVVREDSFTIFGFETLEELAAFDLLRSVTGVGPKSALSIIHQLGVQDLSAAVLNEDDSAFKQVSGIGPKTAKLIVVTLAGKIQGGSARGASSTDADVVSALTGLGYQQKVAEQAVAAAKKDAKDATKEALLRIALQKIGKG